MSREERVRERLNSHGAMGLVALELAALNDLLAGRPTDDEVAEPLWRFNAGTEVWVKARLGNGLAMDGALPLEFGGEFATYCNVSAMIQARPVQ